VLRRLIDTDLQAWKTAELRKPLILTGARQVGKSWAINSFGRAHFKSLVTIDLEKRADLHALFKGSLASRSLLSQLA